MYKDNIISTIQAVSRNLQEVFILAFYLKRFDTVKHKQICDLILISDEFAKSIPDIVKKIILSNKFDIDQDGCVVQKDVSYYIRIGTDFQNKLAYEDSTNNSVEPFVRPIATC